jgi:hypothetical protein
VVGTRLVQSCVTLEAFRPDEPGTIRHRASSVHMGWPCNTFQIFKGFSNSIQPFKVAKCEKGTSMAPKISTTNKVLDKFTWNTFPFYPNFQFSLNFEL